LGVTFLQRQEVSGQCDSNSTLSEESEKGRKVKRRKDERKRKETIQNKGGKEEGKIARKREIT
jgi:hypothetical protein